MTARPIRVYADTSVYGGVADEEFAGPSRTFFDQVRAGRFRLVISSLVRDEIANAPEPVQDLFEKLRQNGEATEITEEGIQLQQAYLDAGILSPKWELDALHVAIATVTQCRVIVSWNFKHIVNFQKIPLYNGINQASGYGVVAIHTPQEVVADEDQDV